MKWLCILLIICLVSQPTQSQNIFFENLHTTFITEISQISNSTLVISGDEAGRIVVQDILNTSTKYQCELGGQIYQASHIEGTDFILVIVGTTKIVKLDYKNGCLQSPLNVSRALNLRRMTHNSVPSGSIYYYFISVQLRQLSVCDIGTMTIIKNISHNSEGYMMSMTEFGSEKLVITAGDDRKLQIWNISNTSAPISVIQDINLTQTITATSIWSLFWIEGTDYLVIAFNDGKAKVINLASKTLLSTFDKQSDSFGITKIQRIEGSNMLISFGYSLETVYVWDYRNPLNFRYKIDSYIHTNTGGSYLQGTGMICLVAPDNVNIVENWRKYVCKKFCGSSELYNFDWAQCTPEEYCKSVNTTQQTLGYCQQCELGQFYGGSGCEPCSQNCKLGLCNQTSGICMENGCVQQAVCDEGYFWNNATCACQQCISPCSTCNPSAPLQVCESCSESGLESPLCNSTSCQNTTRLINEELCIEECPEKYYFDMEVFTCKHCDFGCLKCTDFLTCLEGEDPDNGEDPQLNCSSKQYYNSTLKSCQNCSENCTSCTSSLQCSTCIGQLGFKFSRLIPLCNCPAGSYYISGQNDEACCDLRCASCTFDQCLTCKGNSSSSFPRNVSDFCKCPLGSFDRLAENILDCQACPQGCSACTALNKCDSCIQDQEGSSTQNSLRNVSNICKCPTGFYDDRGLDCIKCYDRCAVCNTSNQCSQCNSTNRNLSNSCLCNTGYFELNGECKPCLADCVSCSNNSTCSSCKGNLTLLQDNTCGCNLFYFRSQNQCLSCPSACKNCSSSTQCTVCNGSNRNSSNLCTCLSGYYSNSTQNDCIQCDARCGTCNGPDICLTCAGVPNLPESRNKSNNCSCPSTYYENSSRQCSPCLKGCQTCTNSTSCITCVTSSNFSRIGEQCLCPEGTYDVVNQQNCSRCPAGCKTCSSSTECLSCLGDPGLPNSRIVSQLCACPVGYFSFLEQFNNCLVCNYKCASCNSSSTCITCSDPKRIVSQNCSCPVGRFEIPNNAECGTCNSLCITCTDLNECQTCIGSAHSNRNKSNGCRCNTGYFEDDTSQDCKPCSPLCRTCSGRSDNCLTCIGTEGKPSSRVVTTGCSCPAGFVSQFENDSSIEECQKQGSCLPSCKTCSNSYSCTYCYDYYSLALRIPSEKCRCPDGYYSCQETHDCKACPEQCSTCTDEKTCLTCVNPRASLRVLSAETVARIAPDCLCPQGYYSDPDTLHCVRCPSKCLTCRSQDRCDICSESMRDPLTCECPPGYYDNNGTCQACTSDKCSSCGADLTCTECIENQNSLRVPPQCECPSASQYYEGNLGNANCVEVINCTNPFCQCSVSQSASACDSCIGQHRDLANGCACLVGYYDLFTQAYPTQNRDCMACNSSCSSCKYSSTNCVECADENAVPPSCACKKGYQSSEDGTTCVKIDCSAVIIGCKTCGSSDECLECFNNELSLPSCRCPPGSTKNLETYECIVCPEECGECNTDLECLSCSDPNLALSSNCTECEVGYHKNETGLCELNSCSAEIQDKCGLCNEDGDCLECANFDRLLPDCECKAGTLDDLPSSSNCWSCDHKCSECSGSTTSCNSCADGNQYRAPPECECPVGMVEDSTDTTSCVFCDEKCAACSETTTSCTSCSGNNRQAPDCECLEGYKASSEQLNSDCLIIGDNGYPDFLPDDFDEGDDGEGLSVPYAAQITAGVVTVYTATFAMVPAVKSIGSGASMFQAASNAHQVLPSGNPIGQVNPMNYQQVPQQNISSFLQQPSHNVPGNNPLQPQPSNLQKLSKKIKLNPIDIV